MNKLITLLLLFSLVACVPAATLKINVVHRKTMPDGRPYGAAGGIYFDVKDMHPVVIYKIQYSKDFKQWHDLEQIATWYDAITSALWHWHELPKHKCFFRIIEAW